MFENRTAEYVLPMKSLRHCVAGIISTPYSSARDWVIVLRTNRCGKGSRRGGTQGVLTNLRML